MHDFQKAIHYYNEGLKLFEKGELEASIDSFRKSIELDDSDPDIFVNLGVAYVKCNMIDLAIEAFVSSIELDPIFARSFNNLGVCLLKLDKIDKAQEKFEKAINFDDSYVPAYLNLSVVFKNKGMVSTSIEMYMKALELSSKNRKGSSEVLGVAFLEDSRKSFDQVFKLTDFDLLASDKWERTELTVEDILNTYRMLHEDEKEGPESYFNIGVELYKKSQYVDAIEYFNKSINLDNKYYPSYYNIGLAYELMGEISNAATAYTESIKVKPTLAAYLSLSLMLYKLGNYSQSTYNIEKAKVIASNNAESFNNIGYALFKIGKVNDAIEFYYKAVDKDPGYSIAYYNLGVVHSKIGEIDQAIESYLKVIEIEPDNVPALNNLGVAYENIGNIDKAIEYYEKTLEINPKYTIAYENLFEILKRKEK
ncbi:MAG: tetratricopeptide repeat protein [Cyanobacteriota bacterium]